MKTDIAEDRWFPMLRRVSGRDVTDVESGETAWFHATRATDASSFRAGIFPLPQSAELTWSALRTLLTDRVTDDQWQTFKLKTEVSHYGIGQDVLKSWMRGKGPYAFLFAETALVPDRGSHDYLAIPELVDFIHRCFERQFRFSLASCHKTATQPFLVKFIVPGIQRRHLGAALDYLVHRAAGLSLSCLDPCFSNEGQQIFPSQMVKAIPAHATARLGCTTYRLSAPELHIPLQPSWSP